MRRHAFSLIELLVVIAIIALLIGILIPALGGAKTGARKLKDSTQVRGIVNALASFGSENEGVFPIPGKLDRTDGTMVASKDFHKDNPGNIYSVLIWNDFIDTESMVSPAEASERIEVDTAYEFDTPSRAPNDGEYALWDPGFSGVPGESDSDTGVGPGGRRGGGSTGHTSYALNPPFGDRLERWQTSGGANQVMVGTRGPLYGGGPGNWILAPSNDGTGSDSLAIFEPIDRWAGHLGFNDGRVTFYEEPDPDDLSFLVGTGSSANTVNDNVFVNENPSTGAGNTVSEPGRFSTNYIRLYRNVRGNSRDEITFTPFYD